MKPALEPFDPEHLCPLCGSGPATVVSHGQPVLVVFGSRGQYPCQGLDGRVGTHLCCRCEACGNAWMEDVRPR